MVNLQDLVGPALETLEARHGIKRQSLFIQSEYPSHIGHEKQNRSESLPEQVLAIFHQYLCNYAIIFSGFLAFNLVF